MSLPLGTYDPKEVSLIFGGQIIEGFADGTFISAERNEDSASFERASQGGGTRTLSRDKSGRITITLQQTSPSNALLQEALNDMEISGGGIRPLLGRDNSGNDVIAAPKTWVVKPPAMAYGNELSNREWILETDDLDMQALGQTA